MSYLLAKFFNLLQTIRSRGTIQFLAVKLQIMYCMQCINKMQVAGAVNCKNAGAEVFCSVSYAPERFTKLQKNATIELVKVEV